MTQRPATYCPDCGTKVVRREFEERERRYCPDCERFVWQNAVPGASVVVHDDSEVLLIERATPPIGAWTVPGGFLEADEAPEIGAARELEEETGLTVAPENLTLLDVEHARIDTRYGISIGFVVERADTSGDLRAGAEAKDVRFWTLDALRTADERTRPFDRRRIQRALRER